MRHWNKFVHETEKYETRSDSKLLLGSMNSYVFIAYLVFWKLVLVEINHGQKFLQISGLGLDACVVKLESLGTFFQEERQNLVEEAKNKAMDFCERLGISTERRVRRRRRMPRENAADAGLSWQDEIKKEQLEILDRLHEEISRRTQQIRDINAKFGFLTTIDFLL